MVIKHQRANANGWVEQGLCHLLRLKARIVQQMAGVQALSEWLQSLTEARMQYRQLFIGGKLVKATAPTHALIEPQSTKGPIVSTFR